MVRAVSLNFNKKLSNGTSAAYIKGLSNLEFSENRCIQTSNDQVGINLALYCEMVMPGIWQRTGIAFGKKKIDL